MSESKFNWMRLLVVGVCQPGGPARKRRCFRVFAAFYAMPVARQNKSTRSHQWKIMYRGLLS